ncbi:hypothetical protein D3C78_1734090 [compost metagenome]
MEASTVTAPAATAATALATPVPRVSWKCTRTGRGCTASTVAATRRDTSSGRATPMVSARAISNGSKAARRRAMPTTRAGSTAPDKGQPKATEMVT